MRTLFLAITFSLFCNFSYAQQCRPYWTMNNACSSWSTTNITDGDILWEFHQNCRTGESYWVQLGVLEKPKPALESDEGKTTPVPEFYDSDEGKTTPVPTFYDESPKIPDIAIPQAKKVNFSVPVTERLWTSHTGHTLRGRFLNYYAKGGDNYVVIEGVQDGFSMEIKIQDLTLENQQYVKSLSNN